MWFWNATAPDASCFSVTKNAQSISSNTRNFLISEPILLNVLQNKMKGFQFLFNLTLSLPFLPHCHSENDQQKCKI